MTPDQFQKIERHPLGKWFDSYARRRKVLDTDEHTQSSVKEEPSIPIPAPLGKEDIPAIERVRNQDGVLEWWKLKRDLLEKFMDAHELLQNVSSDVRSFISEAGRGMDESAISALLQNPVRFFSASGNVPYETRKQIYL